jgi:MFS family permease
MTSDATKAGGPGGWRWRIPLWGGAALLLLSPLVAMQFTSEVAWTGSDFALFGAMLAVVVGGFELAARVARSNAWRAAVGVALVSAFVLVWMNLAVGIIGNEENPANRMFFGVLVVGLAGALLARFRAAGMARVMVAMALAQLAVAIAAQIGGHFVWPLTVVFCGLWLASAALFRKAARDQAAA